MIERGKVMSKARSSGAGFSTPVVLGVILMLAAIGGVAFALVSTRGQAPPSERPNAVSILAAGDIANCNFEEDEKTAAILQREDGLILALGDNAYPDGTVDDYARCFDPTWGQVKKRIRPVPGNHDYKGTSDAAGYFAYFGQAAGRPGAGYYSFDIGAWHIIALNSGNCDDLPEGCTETSPQYEWLQQDLARDHARCTLAYWHHPRFSSGEHGDDREVKEFFTALYEAGADIVLTGHDHDYERFAPVDPEGKPDERGIREFVVGTGGAPLRPFDTVEPTSEVRNDEVHGVLKLTLLPRAYEWEFLPEEAGSFTDSGRGECH